MMLRKRSFMQKIMLLKMVISIFKKTQLTNLKRIFIFLILILSLLRVMELQEAVFEELQLSNRL